MNPDRPHNNLLIQGRSGKPLVLGVLVLIALITSQIFSFSHTHESKVRSLNEDLSMSLVDIETRYNNSVEFLKQLTDDRNKSVLSEDEFRELTMQRFVEYPETVDIFYVNGNGDLTWSASGTRTTDLNASRIEALTALSKLNAESFTNYPENIFVNDEPTLAERHHDPFLSIVQPVQRGDRYLGMFVLLVNFTDLSAESLKDELRSQYAFSLLPDPDIFDPHNSQNPQLVGTLSKDEIDLNYEARSRLLLGSIPFILKFSRLRENWWITSSVLYGVTLLLALALVWSVGAIVRDIRRSKLLNQQINTAREAAESASLAKSRLIGNVSHELRTPVGAIQGYADLIATELPSESSALQSVASIKRNCGNLLELIDDLLDLSKVEAGVLKTNFRSLELKGFLDDIYSVLMPVAADKNLPLQFEAITPLPKTINSDPKRLRQVLINLLSNAIKFTAGGHVSLQVKYDQQNEKLSFLVSDTGLGIAPEMRDLIFDPFFQGDNSGTRRFGGTGLGLAVSRKIATNLKASLELESSEPGQGSTFNLTLSGVKGQDPLSTPVFSAVVTPTWEERNLSSVKPQTLSKINVLLVDDCEDNQVIYARYLQLFGCNVFLASSGREALEIAESRRSVDLVIMDIQMPLEDGVSSACRLRDTGFSGPILALSASTSEVARNHPVFAEYLLKPADPERLVKTILRHLGGNTSLEVGDNSKSAQISDLVHQFVRGLDERQAVIRGLFQQKNWEGLGRMAHQLKGTALAYGYPQLSAIAEKIEKSANMGEVDAVELEEWINAAEASCQSIKACTNMESALPVRSLKPSSSLTI